MKKVLRHDNQNWDHDYTNGRWDFLEEEARELARHALIANYCKCYAPGGWILDVGCGTGILCDFLDRKQRKNYVGIDISTVAISRAKQKFNLNFTCSDAMYFDPARKFDVIIFNEILYYTDFESVLNKYIDVINPNGIFIFSIYRKGNQFDVIWKAIARIFHVIEVVEITVGNNTGTVTWNIEVATRREI